MQVHYDEGIANRIGPEPCAGIREDVGEASAGERAGQPLSRDRKLILGADAVCVAEGNMSKSANASAWATRRGRRTWHARTLFAREPGDLMVGQQHSALCCSGPHWEGEEPKPKPNGYVLGEEAGGAFFGGLRYGEGMLYTKNAGDLKVYWQGPTVGWDFGGAGSRTMMLVYRLPATEAIYQRFGGIDGSAYFIGGFGMTALTANNVVLVPIRSGIGLRLGANVGYLKFTPTSTWNPF